MAAQFLLSISILVGLHELGHLLAAKMFGMRVEKYSIGFPPKIFGIKWGETEYSLGAIPLGGFVKISGMIDESLDTEKLKAIPESWEFRAKPAWQRLIVMMGGIFVNVLLGIFIFIMMTFFLGETYISKTEMNKYGVVAYEYGEKLGFETGDKILKINGKDFEKFADVTSFDVLLGDNSYYTIDRDGQVKDLSVPSDFIETLSDKEAIQNFIRPRSKMVISQISKGKGAEAAGFQEGDVLKSINGQEIVFVDRVATVMLDTLRKYKGDYVTAVLQRDNQEISTKVEVNEEAQLGFAYGADINLSTTDYGLLASIPHGTEKAFGFLIGNIKAIGKMFSGDIDPRKSLQGPIGIAGIFGNVWDWERFWHLTGVLSMILAFMNFLPIPALDGGHVAFLSYEIISGRKPGDKFLENAQKVGMVILLALMVFVIGNDIINLPFFN